jgi:serine/threonine-protein kinase
MGTVLDPNRRPTPGSEGAIVSDEVERVFSKALALDPRDRYADAGVFWNALLAAARITSGELQEVRLPRDSRAEPGGGTRVERVDVSRRPSVRPPSGGLSVPNHARGEHPTLDAPIGSAAPDFRSLSSVPLSPPLSPAISGSFVVPDLDLAPVSRPPVVPRTSSGLRQAIAPPVSLDELADDFGPSASLDLDLPSNDPFVRRASSGGMSAVRPRSEPPPPNSFRTPLPPPRSSYPPPDYSASPPPVAVSNRVPSVPQPAQHQTSLPPVSRAAAPGGAGFEPAAGRYQLRLAADPDATLVQRLLPGGIVLGSAILVTVLDQVYSAVSGELFMIGPLRTSVLAGLVMMLGVALCLYRLKND